MQVIEYPKTIEEFEHVCEILSERNKKFAKANLELRNEINELKEELEQLKNKGDSK